LKRDDTLKVDADIMHGIQVADCLDKLVLIQNNIAERKNDIVERKNDIAERKCELNRLTQNKKQQQEQVNIAVQARLSTMKIVDGSNWLNIIYWKDADLATTVRIAFTQVFGGGFTPTLQNKEVKCKICLAEVVVPCNSWSDYKSKVKGYICRDCLVKQREQKEQKEKEQHRLSQERQEKKDIIFNLRTMPYDEYLYTEHWREFRKVALKNAKNKCQL